MVGVDVNAGQEHRVVARLSEPPGYRCEDLAEEDEGQVAMACVVADDNRDEPRLLGHERACGGIGAVPDLARDLAHAVARLGTHVTPVVQRARDRRDRDAGTRRDVLDRRPIAQNTGVSRQTPQTSLNASHISPIVTFAFDASTIGGIRLRSSYAASCFSRVSAAST